MKLVPVCLPVLALLPVFISQCGPGPTAGKQAIAITAPASGAKLLAGDTVAVQWSQSVSSPVLSYNYHLLASSWQQFATVIPVNSQEAKVALPTKWFSDSFQIKVEDNAGTYDAGLSGYMHEKYIFLTSVLDGQTYHVGDSVNLTWRANPLLFSSLEIRLSLDSGKSYNDIVNHSIEPSSSSLLWIVGAENGWIFSYPSSGCIVQVRDYNTYSQEATSGIFAVSSQ